MLDACAKQTEISHTLSYDSDVAAITLNVFFEQATLSIFTVPCILHRCFLIEASGLIKFCTGCTHTSLTRRLGAAWRRVRGLFERIAIYLMMESVSALCYSSPGTHHFYSGSGPAKTRKTNKKTQMCHTVALELATRKQYSSARPMFGEGLRNGSTFLCWQLVTCFLHDDTDSMTS